MKLLIICIYLTTLSLISEGQIIKDEKAQRVSEPVDTYRRWRTDLLECDSIKSDMQNDLDDKDSVCASLKKQNAALGTIVLYKDSTIRATDKVAQEAIKEGKKDRALSSPITYIIGVAALFLGISIGK